MENHSLQLLQYGGTVALRQPCVHSVRLDGFGGGGGGGAPAGVPAGAPSGECLRDGGDGDGGNRCGSTLDAKSTGNQWRMQFVQLGGAPSAVLAASAIYLAKIR